jgi:4'-phosphopantetheinyl transferase EntD
VIELLLRSPVEAVELRAGAEPDALLPAESAALGEVRDRRRRDFAAGRHCARRALARVGVPPQPILSGPDREPRWPDGLVGSITHCDGYAAAAVARRADVAALGIDAEPHDALPDGVLRLVAGEAERSWIASADAGTCWDRVLFSAKESVFKAWFPLAGRWLGFRDAVVSFTPRSGRFRAELVAPPAEVGIGSLTGFDGRFMVRDGLVLTAVVVSHAGG